MSDPQANPDECASTVCSFKKLCPIFLEIPVPSNVSEELGLGIRVVQ